MDMERRRELGKAEQKKVSAHIGIGAFILWLGLFVITVRYGWLQLVQGDAMETRIRMESGEELVNPTPRGPILDRNGRELAVSLMLKSLFVDPNNVQNPQELASKLAPLINLPEQKILDAVAQGGGFVWVKHYLSTDEVQAVKKLIRDEGYNCLGFNDELKRSYPNNLLAANVLGFVGTDDVGLDGIEQAFDKLIKGSREETFVQTDNYHGFPILSSIFSKRRYEGDQCKTIQLTIDSTAQFIVEQALDEAMLETSPESVTAIVMRPKTGEILAMASRPSYDPNKFDEYPAEVWKNRAVSVIYEPGSTFKSIVAAAALQEKIVTPNQVFHDPGYVMVSERRIQNWNGESFGMVTFTDIVKHSLNTGFAQVGLDLGSNKLTEYAKLFGFGEPTGIELPGEESGILFDPDDMRDSDMATMAIGQSIAVTPLQLVTAMSAIANDGILMKPHIVKSVYNADGSVYSETKPQQVRRAIESVTDKTLVGLLEQVVATGGGAKAQVKGYRIAGKTGTAEKARHDGAGYMDGHYIASFCGFAPVEDPEICLLVVIDDPLGIYYGGQIAAPVASRIFSQLLRHLQIEPSSDPFQGSEKDNVKSDGSQSAEMQRVVVPEVSGLDAAEASLQLEAAGLKMRADGHGIAVGQDVEPNTVVPRGSVVVVKFEPKG